ncbi:AF4/FMR2 family member 1 [Camelus dromedarius]|uniref:AF4/FMR2 family member 1 n=1 Tax=Camelus dromedarius TaxID=9838 RepID=A0A5N4EHB7_CAMDR|nr:AF4/FMR2 family member 1 [Camelus dromedarius]KAB1282881.1 AF4/FMR2 family member 1 [Camelus dromedarius]
MLGNYEEVKEFLSSKSHPQRLDASENSVAMQQKPTAYVRPMDGQDQAPSESPELKPLPEDYRPQTFEKTDLKVPAKAKLTKLKMPSQSVEAVGMDREQNEDGEE